jgi:hypothetical protein
MNGSRLKRNCYAMAEDIHEALIRNSRLKAYYDRPPYQQIDYIAWITREARCYAA